MKMLSLRSRCIISSVVVSCLAVRMISAESTQIEKDFMARHPCTWDRDIIWKQVRKLTRESHRKICDDILPKIVTPLYRNAYKQFQYVEVPEGVDIKKARFIDRALLPIDDCQPAPRIPVLECRYKEQKFYLTVADDNHVFDLDHCGVQETNIFYLGGRIMPIDYERLQVN